MRKGIELGFEEIAVVVLVIIFLLLLVMLVLSIIEPGTKAVSVFGQRAGSVLE